MRVLVTGASGLVGGRLCSTLTARGHEVAPLTRARCELGRASEVNRAFDEAKPDAVVHCASMTDVDGCERQPALAWESNVLAAAHVAAAAKAHGAHLVHVSTDYVFSGDAGPYREADAPSPRGAYAVSKHGGEHAVALLAGSWSIARTAVVFGWPAAVRPNFGAWLAQSLAAGKEAKLFVDQQVSPTLVDNLADMLAELAERRLPGLWHTAGADVVDRVTFGKLLCAELGVDERLVVPVKMASVNLPSPRPAHSGLVVERAATLLQARPLALAAALRRFAEAFRSDAGQLPSPQAGSPPVAGGEGP